VECRDPKKDLEHLKYKVDQGADAVITQLFFDNRDYFNFVERAVAAGIKIPIIPGIMPVTQASQIEKFALMCGAKIPVLMKETILRCGDDSKAVESFGVDYATGQCAELLRLGVPGLHFYTLNKSQATRQIAENLGL
jgi:methylenetetrahydrofolate reductase (NADPH)